MNLTEIDELIYATAAVIANEKIGNGGTKIQLRNTGLEGKNPKSD